MHATTCQHPGCASTFPRSRGRGRPALYCPAHRGTRYAMERKRKHPELREARLRAMPPCCREAGRQCPQHLNGGGTNAEAARAARTVPASMFGGASDSSGKVGWEAVKKRPMRAAGWTEDARAAIGDLLDVFGVAVILSSSGFPIGRYTEEDAGEDW